MSQNLRSLTIVNIIIVGVSLCLMFSTEFCLGFCISSHKDSECIGSLSIYSPKRNGILSIWINLECDYEPSATLSIVLDEQFTLDFEQNGPLVSVSATELEQHVSLAT